jgi:DNA-binding FadR family transcriptional regulator
MGNDPAASRLGDGVPASTRLVERRHLRLAEKVADAIRRRITAGEIAAGATLPTQAALREEFGVSRPTLRDALGILEAEGLVTVRRGSRGGAVVHRYERSDLAGALATALEAEGVGSTDVTAALSELEPLCAALGAGLPSRTDAVVALRAACEDARAVVDDAAELAVRLRRFHEVTTDVCGNATVRTLVGSLQRLWPATDPRWGFDAGGGRGPSLEMRESMLFSHQRIVDLVEAGDVDNVTRLSRQHRCVSRLADDAEAATAAAAAASG